MKKLFMVLSFGFLVACTKSGEDGQSKSLFIYTSMDEPLAKNLTEAYEAETGTKVEFVRLSTGEAAARIEAEKNNPQASLWLGGVGLSHVQLKQRGLSIAYTPKGTESIAKEFKDADNFWTGVYIGVLSFASNKKRLEKLGIQKPNSWQGLLNKKLEDSIQVANPGTSGTSYNVLAALIEKNGEEEAFNYLKKLNSNISQYTRSGSAPAKNAAIGETTIAIGYAHDIIRLIHENKAPLELSFPKEGTGYEIASISLIKDGKQTEMAKEFYDWMYTQKASQILADYYVFPLITEGVTMKEQAISPSDLKLIHVDLEWAGQNRERLVNQWNEKINS